MCCFLFFFFSRRRRHTRCSTVAWARRCVKETGINVETFAAELKVPADVLLEQLRAAGVQKRSASDALSEADKEQLLGALRAAHGGSEARKQKITVVRKQTCLLYTSDAAEERSRGDLGGRRIIKNKKKKDD